MCKKAPAREQQERVEFPTRRRRRATSVLQSARRARELERLVSRGLLSGGGDAAVPARDASVFFYRDVIETKYSVIVFNQ